jgi:hypothetical protein
MQVDGPAKLSHPLVFAVKIGLSSQQSWTSATASGTVDPAGNVAGGQDTGAPLSEHEKSFGPVTMP